ncbi:hypothetical protein ABT324_22675 [Saccharopolyspora sp. NPDC000359]|uniref:hypothetical protein n=1 Tax=Saccharopolyspora sp. NPDC000359 TaxID=3154251 RepID=UPI003324ACD2
MTAHHSNHAHPAAVPGGDWVDDLADQFTELLNVWPPKREDYLTRLLASEPSSDGATAHHTP